MKKFMQVTDTYPITWAKSTNSILNLQKTAKMILAKAAQRF